jgi:hypothetical protein
MMRLGHCWHEDRTHEGAADGILVVQVRRVGTISREISQFAAREALIGFSGRFQAKHGLGQKLQRVARMRAR